MGVATLPPNISTPLDKIFKKCYNIIIKYKKMLDNIFKKCYNIDTKRKVGKPK